MSEDASSPALQPSEEHADGAASAPQPAAPQSGEDASSPAREDLADSAAPPAHEPNSGTWRGQGLADRAEFGHLARATSAAAPGPLVAFRVTRVEATPRYALGGFGLSWRHRAYTPGDQIVHVSIDGPPDAPPPRELIASVAGRALDARPDGPAPEPAVIVGHVRGWVSFDGRRVIYFVACPREEGGAVARPEVVADEAALPLHVREELSRADAVRRLAAAAAPPAAAPAAADRELAGPTWRRRRRGRSRRARLPRRASPVRPGRRRRRGGGLRRGGRRCGAPCAPRHARQGASRAAGPRARPRGRGAAGLCPGVDARWGPVRRALRALLRPLEYVAAAAPEGGPPSVQVDTPQQLAAQSAATPGARAPPSGLPPLPRPQRDRPPPEEGEEPPVNRVLLMEPRQL
jgi:hypothetical protein